MDVNRRAVTVHKVSDEKGYWSAVQRLAGPESVFDAQESAHGKIDEQLAEAIEEVLVPLVGRWENSDTWFHNQDFYGDGIRSLIFRHGAFPFECVPRLRALLTGNAAAFCISIQFCDKLYGPKITTIGAMAIMQNDVVATDSVAGSIPVHA